MKLFKLTLAALALLAFAVACNNTETKQTANTNARTANANASPANAATPAPDEFADARSTYNNACARCHKPDGSGGLFEEPGQKPLKVPSFREGHGAKHTDAQMLKQIQNGGEGMPAFKTRLDQEKIDGLVRFIRHDFEGQAAPAAAATSPTPKH
ncbi:MAG: Cytochrome oxidase, cbb3-type, subunit [Acidobacteriota bacterium]|jgi:mono/diheme cytochrome c family protein|nr:Cytochrome oxidase, cbb3-type, subunit [Acidobacteriota bacterium]